MTTKNMKAYYSIRNQKSAEKKEKERYDKGTREHLERLERLNTLNEFRASIGFNDPITI